MPSFCVSIEGKSEPILVEAENLAAALEAASGPGLRVIGVRATSPEAGDATGWSADSVLVPRERVLASLAHEGADIAYTRIARDQSRYQRAFAIIMAVVGLVGFSSVAAIITLPIKKSITTSLRETDIKRIADTAKAAETTAAKAESRLDRELGDLDSRIATVVEGARISLTDYLTTFTDERVRAVTLQTSAGVALSSLLLLSQKLDIQESFSTELRDQTMNMIKSVILHEPTATLPGFLLVLEPVISSFAAANLSSSLDEIDDLAHAQIVKSSAATSRMALHYGEQLAGDERSASYWKKSTVERFRSYMTEVRDKQVPAIYLPLELLVLYMQEGMQPGSDGIATLIQEPTGWTDTPEAQAAFHVKMMSYSYARSWTRTGSLNSVRLIERRSRKLIRSYQEDLDASVPTRHDWQALVMKVASATLEELTRRADATDDKAERALFVEAHIVFHRYIMHFLDGGYAKLISAEGW